MWPVPTDRGSVPSAREALVAGDNRTRRARGYGDTIVRVGLASVRRSDLADGRTTSHARMVNGRGRGLARR